MQHLSTAMTVRAQVARTNATERLSALMTELVTDEAGEGVISTAIAVLILAFVGAAMFIAFSALTSTACDSIGDRIMAVLGNGSNVNCAAGA